MTRYTINIGDDFPLGGDEPPANGDPRDSWRRRGRRHGLFLRVLFFLAVAAIVISHPLHTLLLIGLVLVLRRSPWLAEWRDKMRDAWRDGGWRNSSWGGGGWGAWQSRWRQRCCNRRAPDAEPRDDSDRDGGYRGFV